MTSMQETIPGDSVRIRDIRASAYRIPTDLPESDGTLEWQYTTLVLTEVDAGEHTGIGYTYADAAAAVMIEKTLKDVVIGKNILDIPCLTGALTAHIRNDGNNGIAMMAVSALDTALWDAKAKLLGLPLCQLLGRSKQEMPVYGSGGFTSYTDKQLRHQLAAWSEQGISYAKIKIGREPDKDLHRVKVAREAIGETSQLFVDANGAYDAREALRLAAEFSSMGVVWMEEPVASDQLEELAFIRDHVPPGINIAAGEYGYNIPYFLKMLEAKAVDVLQADATRCGGISGFLRTGLLCEAYGLPFSSHCAPALHLHAALALPGFYLAEYFHDHVRIEQMLFDGAVLPEDGAMRPDLTRPGMGLAFRHADAKKFRL